MAFRPKSADAIAKMRTAGQTVAEVLGALEAMAAPGVTTGAMDAEARRIAESHGARCLFHGQPHPRGGPPYPGCICASINEELVHGIPGARELAEGDVVSIDFGVEQDGWCADAARTFAIGEVPQRVRRLLEATKASLDLVEGQARAGILWSAVAAQIEAVVAQAGFSVVREYVGHGIGRQMWEAPKIPNYVSRDLVQNDWLLVEGMTICVEPMVNMGRHDVKETDDGWTVVTVDGLPCAHFEDMFVVRKDGAEPLTRLRSPKERG